MPFTVCMMADALSRHRLPITFCGGVRAGASVSNASEAPGCRSLGAPPPRRAARRPSSHASAPGRASHQPVGRDGVHHLAHLHGDLAHGDCWGSTLAFEARRRSHAGHTERCARGASAQVEGAGGEGFGVSDLVAAGHGSGGQARARAPPPPRTCRAEWRAARPARTQTKTVSGSKKKKKGVGRKEGGAARPWIQIRPISEPFDSRLRRTVRRNDRGAPPRAALAGTPHGLL